MTYIDIVAMLAIFQFLFFGILVGQARGKHGVKAPAMVGAAPFERMHRVHMNTLELLVALLPALYAAGRYWPGQYVAALGVVYLVGRFVYWRAYVADPAKRGPGFGLSFFPIVILALAAIGGAVFKG